MSFLNLLNGNSLDILCFNPFNLKNKIMKIEHTKIFHGPSKVLKNFSWLINICLKSFMPPPPQKKTLRHPLLHTAFPKLLADKSGNIKMPNGFFGQNVQVWNRKNENFYWILYIWIGLQSFTKNIGKIEQVKINL